MTIDYKTIRKIAKELAEEDVKERISKGGYFLYNADKYAFYQEKEQEHLDNLNLVLSKFPNIKEPIKNYGEILKIAKELAEEDVKERISKGGYFLYNADKYAFYQEKIFWHFSNLIKKFSAFVERIELDNYKKILTDAKELAEEDVKERISKGGYFLYNADKYAFYQKKRDEHFMKLYNQIKAKEIITPKKEKFKDCLVSSVRDCRIEGVDDSLVFIAGSGDNEFEKEIKTIIYVLEKKGYKRPYFALFREQLNQDAFCTKICSKIIESKFCVVLLNSPIHAEAKSSNPNLRIPSANVYFEYGMMVAFKKKVIPILKKDQKLPFNVQHLDILFYEDISDLSNKLNEIIKES